MLPKISKTHTLRRTVALVCAAFAGLGLAAETLRAQTPVPDPSPSPAVPTPYSSPVFHAGGALTPPPFALPAPVPFPDPLYSQLQGTPTALVPGTLGNAGTNVSTEIPSFLLGNYLPSAPPTTPGFYFPNHFRDGTAFSWSAPLTFLTPNAVAPPTSPTGAILVPTVESTPTAVNVTEYPFIQNMQYVGTQTGTASTPDTILYTGSTIPGLHSGLAPAGSPQLIRQVVYFGRSENITTNTPVGAIYCVDGFTGEVIWRYQTSSYADGAVFSAPAVAYINVLTNAGAAIPVYANKAVVIVGDNNGFVYCLDAAGNGDGTSNSSAATTVTGVPGTVGYPIYGAQPTYGTTTSTTTGSHVGTTSIYWAYRPDPAHPTIPNATGGAAAKFNASANLPVPGPFGIASPNIYVKRSVPTTPAADGTLTSNSIVYLGNTRDCVYALDGLGAANNRTASAATPLPAYNLSLPQAATASTNGTGIEDTVPTCNPLWWFTPDNAANSGISFESTPAVAPPTAPYPVGVVVTSSANPTVSGNATFTATVVDGSGNGGVPTGTVTFSVDGVAQPPAVILAGGVATFTPAAPLAPGSHTITASYSGDASFLAGSNTPAFDEEVDSGVAASGNIVITSSVNPSALGQSVTFTATVTDGLGAPVPAGTVTFSIDGAAQTPAAPVAAGQATSAPVTTLTAGAHNISATYTDTTGITNATPTSFEQYVIGLLEPTVYIGSTQELGATTNAGRLYAIQGLTGPTYSTTTSVGRNISQRPIWAYPNLYFSGKGNVLDANGRALPVRPALGNISGSPVVFTNTDDIIPATASIPAHPRTRIYFAADSGLEVTYSSTGPTTGQPNPRPATDATGRVWAVETNGTTAYTTEGANTAVWSFPEANDPNNAALDATSEPSPPMGAFLDATPAMGFVQFPTTIQYGPTPYMPYTHVDSVNTDVKGKSVPMLYIGTNGSVDLGFYALDVDGGPNAATPTNGDTQRGVYRLESPTGASFTSSPVLVTNSSTYTPAGGTPATSGGNGGAVYATSGNTLLQITATPISNINAAQAFGFVGVDAQFSGGGPISGPAVAAADTHDLAASETTTTTVGGVTTTTATPFTLYNGANATDFVYFGDGVLGFCRGITPIDANYGGAVPPINFGGVVDTNPASQYSNKFFLQAYLFDGVTASATTTDMSKALPLNTTIHGFEWGGFAYVRIGNVVPPCTTAQAAAPTPANLVADPTDTTVTIFFGNGQPVNFSIGSSTVTVPAVVPTGTNAGNPNIATVLTGAVGESVFIQRTDTPTATATFTPPLQLVSESNQKGWLAAYSYPIGGANTRIGDQPGPARRISQATQTATIYTATKDASGAITGYTASGTISLIIQTTLGSQYATGGTATTPPTGIAQTPPSEQPTFGILNPLAIAGYGVPLGLNGPQTAAKPVGDPNGAGPFGPISTPAAPTVQDRAAFSNGSNYINTLPLSGYNPATENPIAVTASLTEQASAAMVPIPIATSVGQVPDGGSGTNAVPGGTYGLQVENRSLIGTNPPSGTYDAALFPALKVGMLPASAHWNDNTGANGPGATVNPLPWEDLPMVSTIITNTSLDYPDIPASAITHTLFPGSTASGTAGTLDGTSVSAKLSLATGSVSNAGAAPTDSIDISVSPPIHQPANMQMWDGTTETATTPRNVNANDNIFPQGYIEGSGNAAGISASGGNNQLVYVDVGGRGRFNTSYPYRGVENFVGVPVNMKTSIQPGNGPGGAISLGNGPSALGIQTEQSTPLGLFDPYNPYYLPFFQPMTVLNEGNTNLLNVQFNQQLFYNNASYPLMAQVDANDPLSALGGFDYYATSGPVSSNQRTTTSGTAFPLPNATASVNEEPFIFRTSLDTDLMRAYGQNPGLLNNMQASYPGSPAVNALYARLGATFHKPRVGVASTMLTVPDVPDSIVPVLSGDTSYNLPVAAVPTFNSTAPPYVGISVPFGTPVGSYATTDLQPLRLFEGEDTPGTYGQFYPPTYKGAYGGQTVPATTPVTQLPVNANSQPLLPASSGVTLNINVIEDRMTDGNTSGALPMIDSQPTVSNGATPPVYTSTPDFAPAAFRDPATGNLSVYWTSGRTPNSFGIYGVNAPFHLGTSATNGSYFYPANPAGHWWQSVGGYTAANALNPVLPITAASPVYSGLTVAEDPLTPANVSAFVVAVSKTAPYNNTLYSYPVTPATSANGTLTPDALGSAAAITPPSSSSQVKYGVKGLYTGFTNPLWAFWTGSTRGRTGLYYNSQASGTWGTTVNLLPVPAGLTAVADASPMLMTTYPGGTQTTAFEVTYSGTAPDGNIDLYVSRYVPNTTTPSQLDLAAFPAVTENLRASTTTSGWYQARDVAWSRTGALNVLVGGQPILYTLANVPLFTKAIYDKASGLLVLTGVKVPQSFQFPYPQPTTNTVYVDAATGRVRFSPALLPVQAALSIQATFSPQARRLTIDSRADTAPVTFLDDTLKPNDAARVTNSTATNNVNADRRWTIWRKSGIAGTPSSATLYFKAQRLTLFLPPVLNTTTGKYVPAQIDPTQSVTVTVNGTDVSSSIDVDYSRGRLYFPISAKAEGVALGSGNQGIVVTYKPVGYASQTPNANPLNTVQWQDEQLANDNAVPPADSAAGSDTVLDYGVPINTAVNENNVAAFLDPFASPTSSHKVWLFWNSTRNGTADIYSETIDPRFAPGL